MGSDENVEEKNDKGEEIQDVEKLIAEKERLDKLFKDKFTRVITVMFTDLKGSTAIAEAEGDFGSRKLIKEHNELVLPPIKNHGTLVKTMGDGTMSYYETAQNALRAAMKIQKDVNNHNIDKKPKVPILIRVGIHTGECVVEENDIFGDAVNVASRFESISNPGEIYLSEETYNLLTDKSEFYCRFVKTAKLKGKKEAFRIYKAFWDEKEIELDKFGTEEEVVVKKGMPLYLKIIIGIAVPAVIVYLLMIGGMIPNPFASSSVDEEDKRSLEINVDVLTEEGAPVDVSTKEDADMEVSTEEDSLEYKEAFPEEEEEEDFSIIEEE